MSRESFIGALHSVADEALEIWNQLDEDPLWRWCAAYALESKAAVMRELQCVALRDACMGTDDAAVAFAAREYMQRKAEHHMAGEMRKSVQEMTAIRWVQWAAEQTGMTAPGPERAAAALDTLQRALGFAARAGADDASDVTP